MRRLHAAIALPVLAAVLAAAPSLRAQSTADPTTLLAQAKVFFDALDYEKAVTALDGVVVILEAKAADDPARKPLAGAYEMRARARFGLGNTADARADFVALLKVDPGYTLTGQVSPRVVALFDEAVKSTVTSLKLSVAPPTAEVRLDGVLVPATTTMPIAVGDHVLSAKQAGYKAITQTVSVLVGQSGEAAIALERVSSVLAIMTVPPEVEVIIDGVSHGRTKPGPPPPEYAEKAAKFGVPASEVSQVMLVQEIAPGSHAVDFKRDCHVSTQRRVSIDKPDDYTLDPVRLERAIASLNVRTNQPGAAVLVDGQQRGVAPLAIADLCEGDHLVELRSATGRYFKRLQARTGDKLDVQATLRPAFALVSSSGQTSAINIDVRLTIERAFEAAQTVTIFAPPADQLKTALDGQQLKADWIAFDANKRAIGQSAEIGAPTRRELTARIAKTFDSQGVASVSVPSNLDRSRVVLALLSAGSAEPDVLEFSVDSPESIAGAVAQLDRVPSLMRPSIGLTAIDVADVEGAVVTSVDANGPAGRAGIQPGDVITKANAQAIDGAVALNALLGGRKADDELTVELKDRAGAPKRADVKVFLTPRLIGLFDQTLLVNRTLLDLRARLQTPGDPLEDAVIRLNLAAALARVENWSDARTELQRVKLPDGPGVANGTVQYLLGLCAEKLGNRADAEAAWRAATSSESLISEDGPSVKELAEAKLAELQRRK